MGALAASQSHLAAQEAADTRTPTSGDRLLQTVASHVAQYESIEAQIRYKARLFETELVGNGVYLQLGRLQAQGVERSMRSRLELKTQTSRGANSLLEINTGSYLYRQRRIGEHQTVDRVDLNRVRREWAALRGAANIAEFESPQKTLAMGGLPKLVTSLSVSFHFGEAKPVQLSTNMRAFEVVGHWRPAKLAEMLPDQREKILSGGNADLSQLPNHIPTEVAISVGSEDLFPHVFEYRRFPTGKVDSDTKTDTYSDQVVMLQFLKVKTNGPIEENQFKFRFDNSVDLPDDRTEEFLPKKAKQTE